MERFGGMEFTIEGEPVLSFDPVPDVFESLDLTSESANLKVWGNGFGFEYHLSSENVARIQSWEDYKGITRLAVLEEKDGAWPVYREPTLTEMVKFLRVANFTLPGTSRTNVLRAQVVARINKQADATEERTRVLRELSASF